MRCPVVGHDGSPGQQAAECGGVRRRSFAEQQLSPMLDCHADLSDALVRFDLDVNERELVADGAACIKRIEVEKIGQLAECEPTFGSEIGAPPINSALCSSAALETPDLSSQSVDGDIDRPLLDALTRPTTDPHGLPPAHRLLVPPTHSSMRSPSGDRQRHRRPAHTPRTRRAHRQRQHPTHPGHRRQGGHAPGHLDYGQNTWPPLGTSVGHDRAGPLAITGQVLLAVDNPVLGSAITGLPESRQPHQATN